MRKRGFPFVEAIKAAGQLRKAMNLSYPQFIALSFQMMSAGEDSSPLWMQARQATGIARFLHGIYDGDTEEGLLFAGQAIGGIHDVPTVKELIDRVIAEAEQTRASLNAKFASS
jgi:NAD(P)H-dependent flavin oxidoreductase YrpB (nitropropane dioxygenase family)